MRLFLDKIPCVARPFSNILHKRHGKLYGDTARCLDRVPYGIEDVLFYPCANVSQRVKNTLEYAENDVLPGFIHFLRRRSDPESRLEPFYERIKNILNNPHANIGQPNDNAAQYAANNIAAASLNLFVEEISNPGESLADLISNYLAKASNQTDSRAKRAAKQPGRAFSNIGIIDISEQINQRGCYGCSKILPVNLSDHFTEFVKHSSSKRS